MAADRFITAEVIGERRIRRGRPDWLREALLEDVEGRFTLIGEGGPASRFGHEEPTEGRRAYRVLEVGGFDIVEISRASAEEWLLRHHRPEPLSD